MYLTNYYTKKFINMTFNFDCFFTIAYPNRERFVWDLPTMKSNDLMDLRKLSAEVKLYNNWVDLLDNGKLPTNCYESTDIPQRRFLAEGCFENHPGLFSLDGFQIGIILDDRNMLKCERMFIMRQFPRLISLHRLDIDLEEASTEDDLVLYSILSDPLGSDPDNITLGYTVFPTTKKLIDQVFLPIKAERLSVKQGPIPPVSSFLRAKRQRHQGAEIFKMSEAELAEKKACILENLSGKTGAIRPGLMSSRVPQIEPKVEPEGQWIQKLDPNGSITYIPPMITQFVKDRPIKDNALTGVEFMTNDSIKTLKEKIDKEFGIRPHLDRDESAEMPTSNDE